MDRFPRFKTPMAATTPLRWRARRRCPFGCRGLRIASQEGCKYVLESDRRDVNPEEALYHLTSQNVPIRSLQVQESSIESILIALMNKP